MIRLIKQEPVLFQAIIQATLALIGAFGVKLGAGQVGSILALTAAILSFWTRTYVTPTADPKAGDGAALVPKPVMASEAKTA
jgi:hypothetical protein